MAMALVCSVDRKNRDVLVHDVVCVENAFALPAFENSFARKREHLEPRLKSFAALHLYLQEEAEYTMASKENFLVDIL
jgi:hypothetical protein